MVLFCVCKFTVCTLPDILNYHLLFKMCMTSLQTSTDISKNLCGHSQFTSMLLKFFKATKLSKYEMSAPKTKFSAGKCRRPQISNGFMQTKLYTAVRRLGCDHRHRNCGCPHGNRGCLHENCRCLHYYIYFNVRVMSAEF